MDRQTDTERFRFEMGIALFSVLMVAGPIILAGCYTRVASAPPRELTLTELEYRNFNMLRFELNRELIGSWQFRRIWYDGSGEQVSLLYFGIDGSIEFRQDIVDPPFTAATGEFRTLSDTLVVRFADREHLEKYFFSVSHDTLVVRNTMEARNDPRPRITGQFDVWLRGEAE